MFDGSGNHHARINDPALVIDDRAVLIIHDVGCIAYPREAEVMNMLPPDAVVQAGINH